MGSARRVAAAAVALALVPACNSKVLRPPVTILVDAGDQRVLASAGDERVVFPTALFSYFPSTVALHAGDSVKFELRSTGEPHTVALGRLVEEAMTAAERLGPGANRADVDALPQMKRLPFVLPSAGSGVPPVNPSAAGRCELGPELPSALGAGDTKGCRRVPGAFDGTQSFYSSGLLADGESFRVKLASRIRPSTYRFMCLVHGPAMSGALRVKPSTQQRPRVITVKHQGQDQIKGLLAQLQTVAREASLHRTEPVFAGLGPAGLVRGILASFTPKDLRVRAGEPVSWQLFSTHSVTFNPTRNAQKGVLLKERGGAVSANADAWTPVPKAPESDEWDGRGMRSSGVMLSPSRAGATYRLVFTSPGRYAYRCLVHPTMTGVVDVRE
jgi:plastocyanin